MACIDPHQTGFVGKGSDHLQLIKFCPSCAPGRGSVAGRNSLAPPYYSQHAVFASLSAFFILVVNRLASYFVGHCLSLLSLTAEKFIFVVHVSVY